MIFHSHANKTHFHKKGCALGLILKVRGFGTRNWPITPTFLRNLVPADRDFQQITIAVVDAESWGEYVTVVSQIANRRNVEFYTPAIATTPQDSFTFRTWQRVISKPVHFVIFGLFYFRPVEVAVAFCLKPLSKMVPLCYSTDQRPSVHVMRA